MKRLKKVIEQPPVLSDLIRQAMRATEAGSLAGIDLITDEVCPDCRGRPDDFPLHRAGVGIPRDEQGRCATCGGDGVVEMESLAPYDELEAQLTKAIKEVRGLQTHSHRWTEEDYCAVCGADGRA